MPPPTHVDVDANLPTEFSLREETPVKVVYKFWVRRPGEEWMTFGPEVTDDDRADRWIILPPLPPGSRFAYWLAIAGHANAAWRVRLGIRQPGAAANPAGASWTESGTLSNTGEFSMPAAVQLDLT
jgi:hypothetical protein